MNNQSSKFLLPLIISLAIALGIWIGNSFTSTKTSFLDNVDDSKAMKMINIIELLNNRYVDSINTEKILEETITEMLHKLDPHSSYIPASELAKMSEMIQGKFGGVGIKFSKIKDTVCVIGVLPNSPSEKEGVLSGDKILKANGKFLSGKNLTNDEIMSHLKGKEGTLVKIQFLRGNKIIEKSITRGQIDIQSIVSKSMITSDVGYVKLDHFSVTSGKEFRNASKELLDQGMKKLILDLRNNGGGVLQSAIEICNEILLPGQEIVSTKGEHTPKKSYFVKGNGLLRKTEIVVLVNTNSASASEVVAGALQDNDRATIIGRRTFGKGLVQEDLRLKDGSNLRLTVARYYTPTGRSIQKPYSSDFELYSQEQFERIESGELYKVDSTLFVDSLKFKTKKGKIVYGGGGIFPDKFVPMDSNQYTFEFLEIMYSGFFQQFVFSYIDDIRNRFGSEQSFIKSYQVSDELYNKFIKDFAKENKSNPNKFNGSKNLIKTHLKGEIGRQVFGESAYFIINGKTDNDVVKALEILK